MPPRAYDYEQIKTLAKERRQRITDLIVLAPQNDPFYCGQPAQRSAAEWFAELWQRFGYRTGVHLRRVHYQLVSQHDATLPDGAAYENTENCWNRLCCASAAARYLGLVDPEAFEDHRNPDPHVFVSGRPWEEEPSWHIDEPVFVLPNVQIALNIDLSLPRPSVSGYNYDIRHQPYQLELWVEKSTMEDVLLPLARELGMNVVTGLGFQSITSVIAFLHRAAGGGRPARILYISDFDPAGADMPPAVARQIEFWLHNYAPEADIALQPLVLTRSQVQEFQLPRIPVKDTDRRKANFEDRYGEGAVELDALEALHPGELAAIVRRAVAPYRDTGLVWRLDQARRDAEAEVTDIWDDAVAPYADELTAIEEELRSLVVSYKDQLRVIGSELHDKLAPYHGRLGELRQAINAVADDLEVELPDRPEPRAAAADEEGWLYRSSRDYLAQIAVYKARRNGHHEEQDDA
jgi:hypothetical protein